MNNLDYSIVMDDHMNKNPDIGNYRYYLIHYF